MDIGEHFTQEISPEYHIYLLPLGESVQKTKLYLTNYPWVARQDSEI